MKDGAKNDIGYRLWHSPDARAVFLLVHGLGAHAGRWEAAADFFCKRGFTSYAVELRDVDLSPGAGARRDESFKSHYSRVLRLREVAARENPGRKIFLAGESMGGLISFILCARYPGLFAGLILLSPAFEVKEKPTFIKAAGMVFTALFLPGGEIKLPFDSSMCTRDEAYVNALDTHPSEYRRVQPGVIFDMFAAQLKAAFIKDRVSIPLLVLTAGEDKLVNSSATAKLFAALKAQDKQLIDFPEMYHSLSVDKGRENVFTEILKWAEKRI